jgi:hypothetical protein
MATAKTPPPEEQTPVEGTVDEREVLAPEPDSGEQRQVTMIPGVPEERPDPEDWTKPGWVEGMFPGDPNTYPDPENPTQSY